MVRGGLVGVRLHLYLITVRAGSEATLETLYFKIS